MSTNFTKEDVQQALKFGDLIARHATFTVNVPQLIEVSRALVWFNSFPKKIEDHVMELLAVKKPEDNNLGKTVKK